LVISSWKTKRREGIPITSGKDHDLTQRLINGDAAAFEDLFKTLNPSMLRVAAALTGNRATGEEIAQDTWMTVLAKLNTFDGRASLKNWIFTILTNKSRTRAKKDGRNVALDLSPPPGNSDQDAFARRFTPKGNWADPPGLWEEITPERILSGRQSLDIVNREINALPKVQSAILTLMENETMSSRKIAEVLGLTEGNIRVHLHRARERIRRVLEDEVKKDEK